MNHDAAMSSSVLDLGRVVVRLGGILLVDDDHLLAAGYLLLLATDEIVATQPAAAV